jgi:beta-mannosidase
VDYYGRWKALHYMARRFYAPVLVSGLENITNQSVAVYVTSDLLKSSSANLTWEVTDPKGESLVKGNETLEISAQASRMVKQLDLRELAGKYGASNLLVWLKLEVSGQPVSENLVTLVYPKELGLADPHLKPAIQKIENGFRVTLTAETPALWAWLTLKDADASYSDNFAHVRPGSPLEIVVKPNRPMTGAEFAGALQVHSLFDTCNPGR